MSDMKLYRILENFDNLESANEKLKQVAEVMQEFSDMPDGQAGERIHARVEARKDRPNERIHARVEERNNDMDTEVVEDGSETWITDSNLIDKVGMAWVEDLELGGSDDEMISAANEWLQRHNVDLSFDAVKDTGDELNWHIADSEVIADDMEYNDNSGAEERIKSRVADRGGCDSASRIHSRVEERGGQDDEVVEDNIEETNTQVQKMGNRVRVTTDGDTTEFDDEETAAAFMGGDMKKDQFTTEGYGPGLVDTAQVIVDKYNTDGAFKARVKQSPEFFNALVDFSGIIDLDHPQSEEIIDILDRWNVSGIAPKDQTGAEDSSRTLEGGDMKKDGYYISDNAGNPLRGPFSSEEEARSHRDYDGRMAIDYFSDHDLEGREMGMVTEAFGLYDDYDMNDDAPEFSTFDSDNPEHRKRLQRGTPVVLDRAICSDPNGDRTGIFTNKSQSGFEGTVIRNCDGKQVEVHLRDIVSADITNNSIYEEYGINFDAMLAEDSMKENINEDISITQTTNPTQPENDTVTITGVGDDVDELAAMMQNAGLSQGYSEYNPDEVDTGEPVNMQQDTAALQMEPGMDHMLNVIDEPDEPEMEDINPQEDMLMMGSTVKILRGSATGEIGTIIDWDDADEEFDEQVHVKLSDGTIRYLGLDDVKSTSIQDEDYDLEPHSNRSELGRPRREQSKHTRRPYSDFDRSQPGYYEPVEETGDDEFELDFELEPSDTELDSIENEPPVSQQFGVSGQEYSNDWTDKDDEPEELNFEDGGEETLMADREVKHANTPDELLAKLDTIINGTSGGLNKPKKMYAPAADGDNPMAVKEDSSTMPTSGAPVTIMFRGKKHRGTIDEVGQNTFTIQSELPFNVVKKNPMGGWRLKDDIEHSKVIIGEDINEAKYSRDELETMLKDLEAEAKQNFSDASLENRIKNIKQMIANIDSGDEQFNENKLVNEHESVEGFLDLYKKITEL